MVASYKMKKIEHTHLKINTDCDAEQVHQHFTKFTYKYFRFKSKLAEEHLYHHNL